MGKKKIAEQKTEAPKDEAAKASTARAASRKAKIASGRVYVTASYNNTVVTVTDEKGNVLTWASAGSVGFSGPKKATPFAASKIISVITEKLKDVGLTNVDVLVRGIGGGRDSAVRSLINQGFNIMSLKDVSSVPHNGPRPPKVRRV